METPSDVGTIEEPLLDSEARMQQILRMAHETEQMGANVLMDLQRQREQLRHANQTLHETNANVDQSNRVIREMLRK